MTVHATVTNVTLLKNDTEELKEELKNDTEESWKITKSPEI